MTAKGIEMNVTISIEKDVLALKARHEAFLKALGGNNPVGCKSVVTEEIELINEFIHKYDGYLSRMEDCVKEFLRNEMKLTEDVTLGLSQLSSSLISFHGVGNDLYVACYFSTVPGTLFEGIYAAYMTNAGMEGSVCSIRGRLVSFDTTC